MKKVLLLFLGFSFTYASAQSISCGNATNAFTILGTGQNQVAANQDLNTILFIHRQDVNIHSEPPSASGKYRYSFSTDGGATFTENVGVLNTTYSLNSRYPNVVLRNPVGNTTPTNSFVIWEGLP